MDRKHINKSKKVLSTKIIGSFGETAVAQLYVKNNYQIIAQNWHWSNKGELDIIAFDSLNSILVICEVKTRKIDSVISGREAVNKAKQRRLQMLATVFTQKNKIYLNSNIRFDVAEVIVDNNQNNIISIDIIKNAF